MALKKLLRLVNQNLGTESSLALQGLSIINALDNKNLKPPTSSRNDNIMLHLANSDVHLHSVVQSSHLPSHAAGNGDDSTSTNPENVNESISAVQ